MDATAGRQDHVAGQTPKRLIAGAEKHENAEFEQFGWFLDGQVTQKYLPVLGFGLYFWRRKSVFLFSCSDASLLMREMLRKERKLAPVLFTLKKQDATSKKR